MVLSISELVKALVSVVSLIDTVSVSVVETCSDVVDKRPVVVSVVVLSVVWLVA